MDNNYPDNVNYKDKSAPWNRPDDNWDFASVDECESCGDICYVDENFICHKCYLEKLMEDT